MRLKHEALAMVTLCSHRFHGDGAEAKPVVAGIKYGMNCFVLTLELCDGVCWSLLVRNENHKARRNRAAEDVS